MRFTIWDPSREMAYFQKAVNELFSGFPVRRGASYPPVKMADKDDVLTITAEVPGVNKGEVELTILGNTLTVAGEKKLPTEGNVTYIRHERPHGKFRRLIDLPYSVDQEKTLASCKDGVLTITLPKAEEAKPRQLKVD
jgi:HSP20 family protein